MDRRRRSSVCLYFNSRPSARGDGGQGSAVDGYVLFQFTPLREGRPCLRILLTKRTGYFNSRPSARGDAASSIVRAQASYFNSRPSARGDQRFPSKTHPALFQFTPLREGRPAVRFSIFLTSYFNSRPSARGDRRRCAYRRPVLYFNSRPSARGDSCQL